MRAARALAAWAFKTLALERIVLEIEPDNAPSVRVAEALGAVPQTESHTEVDRDGVSRPLVSYVLEPRR